MALRKSVSAKMRRTALKVKSDFICLTENGQQGSPHRFLEGFMHTGVKGRTE